MEFFDDDDRKFSVGDRVKVKYREQEGYITDINGDLYTVSLDDGMFVDSYYEDELERWQKCKEDENSGVKLMPIEDVEIVLNKKQTRSVVYRKLNEKLKKMTEEVYKEKYKFSKSSNQ